MKFLKQIAAVLVIGAATLAADAATWTGVSTNAAARMNRVLDNWGYITSITFNNQNATTNTVVRLFDVPSTVTTNNPGFPVGASTNYAMTPLYFTNTFTDALGKTVTNINLLMTNAPTTVSAFTQPYPQLGVYTITTNSPSLTRNFDPPIPVTFGLAFTNSVLQSDLSVSVTYFR